MKKINWWPVLITAFIVLGWIIALLLLSGCGAKQMPEVKPMPMFTLKAAPGNFISVAGIGELTLYHTPDPSLYQDQASLAWAGVANKFLGVGLPILGMWGQTYTLSKRMVEMAPLFGDGNVTLNPSNFSGQQDLRLMSPNETTSTTSTRTSGSVE